MTRPKSTRPTLYQLWDISLPKLPPRSRLYHLAPIGVGTPDVESLTSYIMRLAAAHGVRNGTIIVQEIARLIDKSETESMTEDHWASALESLTGQSNLRPLTLAPWRNVVTDPLLRKNRAWCPDCLADGIADDKDKYRPVYEKLAWKFRFGSVCILHKRFLEESCPLCGRPSRIFTVKSRPGYCVHCKGWLGSDKQSQIGGKGRFGRDMEQEIENAKLVGNLLMESAKQPTPLSQIAFANILNYRARQSLSIYQDKELHLCMSCFAQLLFWLPISHHGGFDLCGRCLSQLLNWSPNGVVTEICDIKPLSAEYWTHVL